MAVTVKDPAVPATNVVLAALVIVGAWLALGGDAKIAPYAHVGLVERSSVQDTDVPVDVAKVLPAPKASVPAEVPVSIFHLESDRTPPPGMSPLVEFELEDPEFSAPPTLPLPLLLSLPP